MADENKQETGKTGLYEKAVEWVTEKLEDRLHKRTNRFVQKSIAKYAPDNPEYAKMIEFEIRRRGDGPGLTQDVAEPLVWTGIKTAFALLVAVVGKTFQNREPDKKWPGAVKWIGLGAAATIVANQVVELFRLIPRYTAGLQGSLRMALEREKSIEAGHGDPFAKQQEREIYKDGDVLPPSEAAGAAKPHAVTGALDSASATPVKQQQHSLQG